MLRSVTFESGWLFCRKHFSQHIPMHVLTLPAGLMQVSFQDVHMRYRPGLPLVLKGLSITIQPGTNCGIVGRTGNASAASSIRLPPAAEPVVAKLCLHTKPCRCQNCIKSMLCSGMVLISTGASGSTPPSSLKCAECNLCLGAAPRTVMSLLLHGEANLLLGSVLYSQLWCVICLVAFASQPHIS